MQDVGVRAQVTFVETIHLSAGYDCLPDENALKTIRTNGNIQQWRNEANADLVALICGEIPSGFPAGGIAYLNKPESATGHDQLQFYAMNHEVRPFLLYISLLGAFHLLLSHNSFRL